MARLIATNGDHAATALAAHFPDAEILIWRDVLVEGPVPGGIDDEALADIRARHIEACFGMKRGDVRQDFTRRDRAFDSIAAGDRIELWFETDLHDQLQLIQFLERMARRDDRPSLKFTLSPPPLSSHVDAMARQLAAISSEQLTEAAALWRAFRTETPPAIFKAASENGPLPETRASFARLLEELPAPGDGLGRIERRALLAIRDGAITPGLAFRHYQQSEPIAFLGDLGFFHRLDALSRGPAPLVRGLPAGGIADAAGHNESLEYTHTPIELTDVGQAVLETRADFIALNGIDRWVGGVHLTPQNLWRYDADTKKLIGPG